MMDLENFQKMPIISVELKLLQNGSIKFLKKGNSRPFFKVSQYNFPQVILDLLILVQSIPINRYDNLFQKP